MSSLIGQTIRNYQLSELIGKGGHGTVYKGYDTESNQFVAVKVMLARHIEDNIVIQRLHQEADIIRDLRHPHIVPLIESWEDGNGVCLVMPWIDGEDLRGHIKREGKLSPLVVSSILTQICSALDAAHAAQIVHRDIKPENILVDKTGNAYLTDFGFAKRKDQSNFATTAGAIVGSPNYLSPEQIKLEEISHRTDIFPMGIILFEMLAGAHPFADTTTRMQMILRILNEDVPSLEDDDIPRQWLAEINALIARCAAKSPEERYLTASSVAYHFTKIIENHHKSP